MVLKEEDTAMANTNGTLTNGAAKRKVRESLARPSYADAESSDDDVPLVSPLRSGLKAFKNTHLYGIEQEKKGVYCYRIRF